MPQSISDQLKGVLNDWEMGIGSPIEHPFIALLNINDETVTVFLVKKVSKLNSDNFVITICYSFGINSKQVIRLISLNLIFETVIQIVKEL